jgi:hypothetical protein
MRQVRDKEMTSKLKNGALPWSLKSIFKLLSNKATRVKRNPLLAHKMIILPTLPYN